VKTGVRSFIYSIRMRLTLWYVVLLAIVLTLFSGALYVALSITLHDNLDDALSGSAALLASALEVDAQGHLIVGPGQLTPWNDPDDPNEGDYFWRVMTPSGQVMEQSSTYEIGDPTLDPAVIRAALNGREVVKTIDVEHHPVRMYTVPVYQRGQAIGIVQLGLSADDIYETLAAFRWIVILALPATLLIASAGGLFLASRAFDPVDQITRAAQSIGAHDLSQRLDLDLPDDELGRLARTFDAMIARLDDAFWHQRRFVADASHELRTPLTIIKGDLSLTLARPRDADHYHQVLTEIDEEVDHMNRLVKRLLILARADAEGLTLRRQTVDLSVLLADLIEQTRPLAEAKGLTLTAQIAHDLTASVDPDAVTQVVLNLLDNAIKYTPSGQVRLSAHRARHDSGQILIAVSDSGIGIPAEHLPRIFERFYRVDQARSRELGGAGLGLAIARRLARAHGGGVVVHSVPEKGSTFTVRLPVE
jgi:heavy metal sensor kinase